MPNRIIAVVGLPGAGKSEIVKFLEEKGYFKVYLGAITFDEIQRRGLETNNENERMIREEIRAKHGMGAYATLNIDKIRDAFAKGNVVVESMYSWQEYLIFKEEFKDAFSVLAVYAPPTIRHHRIVNRVEFKNGKQRHFSLEDAANRDKAQIENIAIAGPITVADYTIINETSLDYAKSELEKFLTKSNVQE